MFKRNHYVFMAEAGDGSAGGAGVGADGGAGGAGTTGAGAAGSGVGGDNASASAGGAGAGSALASGAAALPGGSSGGTANPGATDPNAWVAEKHRVFAEDGKTLNLEATARKVAEAYTHAEKKIGSGDVPPAAATDYKITVPASLAEAIKADDLAKDPGFKALTATLHAAGLSQKQFDAVTAEMLTRGAQMRQANAALDSAECTASLKAIDGWKSDAEYSTQMGNAFRAVKAYGGTNVDTLLADYGNDPRICQLLAAVGKELSEDRQASPEAQAQVAASLDQLQADPAFLNDRDPKHANIVAQVNALTAKLAGTRPVMGGKSMSFNS